MTKCIRIGVVASLLLVGPASGGAEAQTDMSRFPLARALPADAYIAVMARANPERAFLNDYWSEVTQAFLDSGILEDVWDLVTELVPDEELEQVEDMRERFGSLCEAVDWGELFEKEMIYAGRFYSPVSGTMMSEGVLMGRLGKKKAKANYAGLKAIIEEFGNLVASEGGEGAVSVTETKENGVSITRLGPGDGPDIGLSVARWKGILIVSFGGEGILRESVAFLRGSSDKTRLIETPRFKQALTALPAAEDSLVFFDIEGMFRPMRSTFGQVAKLAEEEEHGVDPETGAMLGLMSALVNDLSILDYMVTVEWTDGFRVYTESITRLKPDAKGKPLYDIFAGGRPAKKFERFIPKEADNFSCTSGVNLSKLYRYILGFVNRNVPGGEEFIAQLEELQKENWELDIDKDILRLFDGSMTSVTMGKDWFVMFRVTDSEKASDLISRLLDMINGALGGDNALMVSEVEVAGRSGFRQVSHPMMMMMGGFRPPVVGCAEGHLIIGSSAQTVATCLQTARGKHPNITQNKRWRKEALVPTSGTLDAISFTDETHMAEELQAMIGGLSMGMGMLGMFAQGVPPEVQSVLSTLPSILGKLVPVVGKLDFYQSSSSYSTFDGKAWHTRKVQNYKPPKPKLPSAQKHEEEAGRI